MTPEHALKKLTTLEREALNGPFNLADGHARHAEPSFWLAYAGLTQEVLSSTLQTVAERAFVDALGRVLGQSIIGAGRDHVLLPSASLALEVVANLLRLRGMSLLAPEPCFDNVIDLFRRHHVPLEAYDVEPISTGSQPDLPELLGVITDSSCDAVLIVAPGNPAGNLSDSETLVALCEACQKASKFIVLDASFRVFSASLSRTDIYEALASSGCRFAVVEDTGKFVSSAYPVGSVWLG